MTHIMQSMKRSYLFEEIVQTMRSYIAVTCIRLTILGTRFILIKVEDNLTPEKSHRVKVSSKTLLKFALLKK